MLNFYGSFFTLIFAVLLVGANFYMRPETRLLHSSYLRYKVKLPTSDSSSTEITAGGIKVRLEGPVHLDAPSGKNTFVLNASSSSSFRDIMWSQITLGGPAPPGRPQQK